MSEKKESRVLRAGKNLALFGKKMIIIGGIYSVLAPGLVLGWFKYHRAYERSQENKGKKR